MNGGNYRGIKLMCHSMKLYERVHENRLRNIVTIREEQFGFVKGKSTTDATFALRQLKERHREGQQEIHWKKPTTEFRGKNCIGACDTRGCQRSTSDW